MRPIITTSLTLLALIMIPTLDWYFHQGITGLTLLLSLGVLLTTYVRLLTWRRRRKAEAMRDAALRRSARAAGFESFIKNQKGETDYRELFWLLLAMVCLGLLIAFTFFPSACWGGDPVELIVDETFGQFSRELFPAVPLTENELGQLQKIGLELLVLGGMLGQNPQKMKPEIVELRGRIRRLLDSAQEICTAAQIEHVSSIVRATRKPVKGGAK